MEPSVIQIEKQPIGFVLFVKTRRNTKYWCWAYADEATAQLVKSKLYERWDECPVQKYEDYTLTFVSSLENVKSTNFQLTDIAEKAWINTPLNKIDLKKESGI